MRLFRQLNVWSVDVALAAGLLSFVFARIWNIDVPYTVPILLAIAVWIIYTFDHIKDALETREPGLSERRNFHRKHIKTLILTCILLLILAAVLIFHVPVQVVIYGASLTCFVCAYYLAIHLVGSRMPLKKEFAVAIIYAAGVVLGPLSLGHPPEGFYIHILQLFLLALNNLALFSWFDKDLDAREGFVNLTHVLPDKHMRNWLVLFAGSQAAFALIMIMLGFYPLFECFWAFMCIAMLLPVLRPQYWEKNYRYRVLGDLLFFVPSGLLLLF